MLWEGQELGENYFLPDVGAGRVSLLRPVRWDLFYDRAGYRLLTLVRRLLAIRRARAHVREGQYFFFDHWERYQSRGVLLFACYQGSAYTLVAVNMGDADQTVPFWFPVTGSYAEELHGGAALTNVIAYQETPLLVPSNYGRVWTAEGERQRVVLTILKAVL